MKDRTVKVLLIPNLLVLILPRPSVSLPSTAAQSSSSAKDSPEWTRLMDEDQADRMAPSGNQIDWKIVGSRDDARLKRVKELYSQNLLRPGMTALMRVYFCNTATRRNTIFWHMNCAWWQSA